MKYEYQIQSREEGKDWESDWIDEDKIYTSLKEVRQTVSWYMEVDKTVDRKYDYRIMCRLIPDWDFLEEYDYEPEFLEEK